MLCLLCCTSQSFISITIQTSMHLHAYKVKSNYNAPHSRCIMLLSAIMRERFTSVPITLSTFWFTHFLRSAFSVLVHSFLIRELCRLITSLREDSHVQLLCYPIISLSMSCHIQVAAFATFFWILQACFHLLMSCINIAL